MDEIIEALDRLYKGSESGVALIDADTTVLWCNDISVNILERLAAGERLDKVMPSVFWTQAKLLISRGRTAELIVSLTRKRYNILIEPFSDGEKTKYAICHFNRQYHSADLATSVILHDLRHPINVMLSACGGGDVKDSLIERNCKIALGLINDLSIVASDDMNEAVHRPHPVNMTELMGEIFGECREILEGKCSVKVTLPKDPVICSVDRSKIENAVANLIWNAGRYNDKYIGLSLEKNEDNAVISVENDGGRISPEVRDVLFEPCVKADSDGWGLGLYIARTVAENCGGRIYCTEGDVTRFSIELPTLTETAVRCAPADDYRTNTEYLKYRMEQNG